MAEAEAARHVGGAHQVAAQQLVERREGRRLADVCGSRHELGLERVARDGGAVEREPRALREQRELLAQRRGHGGRHVRTRQ